MEVWDRRERSLEVGAQLDHHRLEPHEVVHLGHVGSKVRSRWLHFGSLWSSYRLTLEQKVDESWHIEEHYEKVLP